MRFKLDDRDNNTLRNSFGTITRNISPKINF